MNYNEIVDYYYDQSDLDRFWEKVDDISNLDACWEWTAGLDGRGYSQFWLNNKNLKGYRFSYVLHYGSFKRWKKIKGIWREVIVRHKPEECHNPICINPNHLILGTQKNNVSDKDLDDTHSHGERSHYAILNWKIVFDIREEHRFNNYRGFIPVKMKEYNVSRTCIKDIIHYKSWIPKFDPSSKRRAEYKKWGKL